MKKFVGAGGTPGGVGEFVMGVLMSCTGGYLVLNQISVTSRFFLPWFGHNTNAFGTVFTVFLLGLTFIFYDAKSMLGWGMSLTGLLATAYGVLANLEIYYRQTSAVAAFMMFGLIAAGMGLILKSLSAHGEGRGQE